MNVNTGHNKLLSKLSYKVIFLMRMGQEVDPYVTFDTQQILLEMSMLQQPDIDQDNMTCHNQVIAGLITNPKDIYFDIWHWLSWDL